MIPATSIAFQQDGTAWWTPKALRRQGVTNTVGDSWHDPSWFMSLDRPCDRGCGDRLGLPKSDPRAMPCDCIDGRHTFEVKVHHDRCLGVENGMDCGGTDCRWNHESDTRTMRVSVVPGMVLPLLDGDVVHEVYPPDGIYRTRAEWWLDSDWENIIDPFPPDAKPGGWAAQLLVTA